MRLFRSMDSFNLKIIGILSGKPIFELGGNNKDVEYHSTLLLGLSKILYNWFY